MTDDDTCGCDCQFGGTCDDCRDGVHDCGCCDDDGSDQDEGERRLSAEEDQEDQDDPPGGA